MYFFIYIGGWNAGSGSYSMMAADPQKRKTFIDSLSEFLDIYHFDGVDLDWVRYEIKNLVLNSVFPKNTK